MKFEVELLTKNISIVKLDELFLNSEIISIISSNHGEFGDKNVGSIRLTISVLTKITNLR